MKLTTVSMVELPFATMSSLPFCAAVTSASICWRCV